MLVDQQDGNVFPLRQLLERALDDGHVSVSFDDEEVLAFGGAVAYSREEEARDRVLLLLLYFVCLFVCWLVGWSFFF